MEKEIGKLTEAFKSLASGNYNVKLKLRDELLYDLNDQFDALVDSLKNQAGSSKINVEALGIKEEDVEKYITMGLECEKKDSDFEEFVHTFESIIDSVSSGNMKARLDTKNLEGSLRVLSEATNNLVSIVDKAFADTILGLNALQNGKFDARITTEYQGDFDVVKQAANDTAAKL